KGNKHKKSHSQKGAKGQNQGKGKFAPKPKIPPPPKRENPTKDSICHECGEIGHWKRNCPQYLSELMKKKKNTASRDGGSDVCGPFKIMSRQVASYFVTFTDDFSRYGYVYLLKHKHEVFETFKVFQKEVENQLGKTIKLLRFDCGGEYMSQEFLDHLKDHGIIDHRTPLYTPQHNGYLKETMGYSFYYPPENKVIVAQNAEFLENSLIDQEASGSLEDLKIIQEEDTHPSLDISLNHKEEDLEIDEPQRDLGEPANYKAALLDPEKRLNAMNVEMQSMKDNVLNAIVEENVEEKVKAEDYSSSILTVEQLLDKISKVAEVTLMGSGPMDMDSQTADFEFELESMSDDDLQSLLGFKTCVSYSRHLDHVRKEVSVLHYKVKEMESSIASKVFTDIKSFVPDLISHSLKAQLPGLLSDAGISSIEQTGCQHMNRQPNIAHKAESLRFVTLQKALTKVLKTEMGDSISLKVSLGMQDAREDLISQTKHLSKYCLSVQDMHSQLQKVKRTLEAAVIMDDHAEGEKSKERQTVNLKTTEDDTDYDELDKEPMSKKFKIMTPIPNFQTPTPLCSIHPEHMMKHAPQQESIQEFTNKLFQTTSSSLSPTLLKEPSPLRDPAKGKCVDIKEPVNVLVPFMDEGGSNPKMPSLKPFMNIEGVSTQEEFIKQLTEIKRLADLRAQEEESEKALNKLLNPATIKAQVLNGKEHKEKKAKLVTEYYEEVLPRSNCRCEELQSTCDREHSRVLELEAEIAEKQQMLAKSKNQNSLIQKQFVDLQVKFQNYKECLHNQKLKKGLTSLKIQNDGYKVTNANWNKCYQELSKANTHLRTTSLEKIATQKAEIATLKAEAVGKKNSATGTPTKPKKPPVQHKKPTIPVNMFPKAKPATKARKPIPKRNTRNHNPLPAKSVKAMRAANYYRNLTQDAIRRNSSKAKEMCNKLNFVIEARSDVIEARKIILNNLDNLEVNVVLISCPDKFSCKLDSSIKFTCLKGDLTLSSNLCDP
nr:retrovirus-related Pol polyprotein from transposon TNT 1-94 [Tanacetum cinerariifolium]